MIKTVDNRGDKPYNNKDMNEELIILVQGDNYIYILQQGKQACVIDPSGYQAVQAVLKERDLQLVKILNTHHHFDHTGGNRRLKEEYGCQVLAGSRRTQGVDKVLEGVKKIDFGRLTLSVIKTPGHTMDSLCFLMEGEKKILFTGDTLFTAGCGRLFEGTPALMWDSLQRLKALPGDTQVCPGHNYTEDNLAFALSIYPRNKAILEFKKTARQKFSLGANYLKSNIDLEKKINPFLLARDVGEFGLLRQKKDIF